MISIHKEPFEVPHTYQGVKNFKVLFGTSCLKSVFACPDSDVGYCDFIFMFIINGSSSSSSSSSSKSGITILIISIIFLSLLLFLLSSDFK